MASRQPYTADEVRQAWQYHQNADHIQHQRHIVFVLVETILFSAFGRTEPQVPNWIVALAGVLVAGLWCGVANTLEYRLDAMRRVLEMDRIWKEYIEAVSTQNLLGGRLVFNWILPILTVLLWAAVWLATRH